MTVSTKINSNLSLKRLPQNPRMGIGGEGVPRAEPVQKGDISPQEHLKKKTSQFSFPWVALGIVVTNVRSCGGARIAGTRSFLDEGRLNVEAVVRLRGRGGNRISPAAYQGIRIRYQLQKAGWEKLEKKAASNRPRGTQRWYHQEVRFPSALYKNPQR